MHPSYHSIYYLYTHTHIHPSLFTSTHFTLFHPIPLHFIPCTDIYPPRVLPSLCLHDHQAPNAEVGSIIRVNALCDFLINKLQYRYFCLSLHLFEPIENRPRDIIEKASSGVEYTVNLPCCPGRSTLSIPTVFGSLKELERIDVPHLDSMRRFNTLNGVQITQNYHLHTTHEQDPSSYPRTVYLYWRHSTLISVQ